MKIHDERTNIHTRMSSDSVVALSYRILGANMLSEDEGNLSQVLAPPIHLCLVETSDLVSQWYIIFSRDAEDPNWIRRDPIPDRFSLLPVHPFSTAFPRLWLCCCLLQGLFPLMPWRETGRPGPSGHKALWCWSRGFQQHPLICNGTKLPAVSIAGDSLERGRTAPDQTQFLQMLLKNKIDSCLQIWNQRNISAKHSNFILKDFPCRHTH